MKRHLIRSLTWAAVFAFLAGLTLWVSSYWRFIQFSLGREADSSTYQLVSNYGRLSLHYRSMYSWTHTEIGLAKPYPVPSEWLGFGFWPKTWIANSYSGDYAFSSLQVPWWFVVTLLGMNAAVCVMVWRRHDSRTDRDRAGLCRHCGYDLCASPDRCPECGAEVPTSTASRNP